MGARYYQPELGRWTQQDPSGQDANAYAYVGGNPVNFVDPSGLYCVFGTYGGPGGACRGGSVDDEDVGIGKAAKECAKVGTGAGAGGAAAGAIGGAVTTGGLASGPAAALGFLGGYVGGCISGAAKSGLDDLDQ
jgi:uncharacterized protein RhaS with RHS repeats